MADRIFDSSWVDRYVRNELSDDEAMAFEAALFDSPALRSDVEAALALQSILTLDDESSAKAQSIAEPTPRRVQPWQPPAMAASLLVGFVGVAMWFTSASQVAELRGEITELSRSYDDVIIRRLDVTRSGGASSGTPVLKPAGHSLLVMDIELSPRAKDLDHMQVELVGDNGQVVSSWSGPTLDRNRVTIGVRSTQVAVGPMAIEFRSSDGALLDRRLLEFR